MGRLPTAASFFLSGSSRVCSAVSSSPISHDAFDAGHLRFSGALQPLAQPCGFADHLKPARQTEWVVYAKAPFAGPQQVLDYVGRYTHRIAISNQRLIDMRRRPRPLSVQGLPRRPSAIPEDDGPGRAPNSSAAFSCHVLPSGFHRIRYYGLLGNRHRHAKLARCRQLLTMPCADTIRRRTVVAGLSRSLRGAHGHLLADVPRAAASRPHARDRAPDPARPLPCRSSTPHDHSIPPIPPRPPTRAGASVESCGICGVRMLSRQLRFPSAVPSADAEPLLDDLRAVFGAHQSRSITAFCATTTRFNPHSAALCTRLSPIQFLLTVAAMSPCHPDSTSSSAAPLS